MKNRTKPEKRSTIQANASSKKTLYPPADTAQLRRRAEEKLNNRPGGQGAGKATQSEAVDPRMLVQELQIHQIELEMQNEELRKSRVEMEALLNEYIDLYDFAPVGYFTLERDGTIRRMNLYGAQLLGEERARQINRRFGQFVAEADRPVFNIFLHKVLTGRTKQTCEVALRKLEKGLSSPESSGAFPVGEIGQLKVFIEGIATENAYECRAVMTDITDRKKMEEVLQKVHDGLEQQVDERTVKLTTALSEIKTMKDQLEAENIYFRREHALKHQFEHILGRSDGLKYVLFRAEQVAPANTTVLILGETGTGKDLIGAAIHNMSPRRERPLITVNCAALPGNLIESELFGREKGAFTGADTRQVGRFEIANGSTLCLDEIGELPLELQAKLLRVIQHSEFERLGSSQTVKVDVRIVATTNRDLEEEVKKGRFRQDLYYRLNVFPITVPPLRQRKEDIPLMVRAFIERYSRKLGKQITSIPKEAMKALQDYPWPGNVRELESIIERAVILCPGPVLQLADKLAITSPPLSSAVKTLEETERNQILKILSETRWRIEGKGGAATILGINPSTLRARIHKLGIVRSATKEPD